jgi:SAM-dependent methyltransferase
MRTNTNETPADDAASFWERHYQARTGGEARANPLLTETAGPLPPGTALDLGCGAGGDTVWLARHGWTVTAVDISRTAVDRVLALARELGLQDRVTGERHDLAATFPSGGFDLISAQYLQTPYPLDRTRALRTAAHALRPGGLLLIVDHGSTAPWSWNQDPDAHFPAPDTIAADLALDPAWWSVVRADMPSRTAQGPGGRSATVIDNVLLLRREGGPDGDPA